MKKSSRWMIGLALLFFVTAFAGAIYDKSLGRPLSFSDFIGVTLSLLFLCLGSLVAHSDFLANHRRLEERIRSLEQRVADLARGAS